jgi:hypothetical protein
MSHRGVGAGGNLPVCNDVACHTAVWALVAT